VSKGRTQTLKEENRNRIIAYLAAQFVLFALFSGIITLTFKDVNELVLKLTGLSGISLLSFPVCIILEGLIPPNVKAMLVDQRQLGIPPGDN
jgi:hypothetical protein